VEELLRRFKLEPGMCVRKLSKGQGTRIRLVTAMAFRPYVLLLDEPATGLDLAAGGVCSRASWTWSATRPAPWLSARTCWATSSGGRPSGRLTGRDREGGADDELMAPAAPSRRPSRPGSGRMNGLLIHARVRLLAVLRDPFSLLVLTVAVWRPALLASADGPAGPLLSLGGRPEPAFIATLFAFQWLYLFPILPALVVRGRVAGSPGTTASRCTPCPACQSAPPRG